MKKRIFIFVFLTVTVLSVMFVCIRSESGESESVVSPDSEYVVVIDAGHGGIDGGVVGVNGLVEKEINLVVAKSLESNLTALGIKAVLTRTTDAGLYGTIAKGFKRRDMEKRKEIILQSNADAVISVHMNSYKPDPSRRGAQVFYKTESEVSKNFADCVQTRLNAIKQTERNNSVLAGDYYILNCTEIPSVLVECCFLSNPQDELLIQDTAYVDKLTKEIALGIVTFFF